MPKSYLQVSEYYPTCINGSLTVYIAGTTELATVFNPISGAEISNPIPIGSDGYVQAYNVLNGVYYDVFAKDANGAVRFERQNIYPFVELQLGETDSTTYRGDRGKIAYDHSQTTGNPHGATASDVGAASALHGDQHGYGESDAVSIDTRQISNMSAFMRSVNDDASAADARKTLEAAPSTATLTDSALSTTLPTAGTATELGTLLQQIRNNLKGIIGVFVRKDASAILNGGTVGYWGKVFEITGMGPTYDRGEFTIAWKMYNGTYYQGELQINVDGGNSGPLISMNQIGPISSVMFTAVRNGTTWEIWAKQMYLSYNIMHLQVLFSALSTITGFIATTTTASVSGTAATVFRYLTQAKLEFIDSVQTKLNGKVGKTGDEMIDGSKTFNSIPIVPNLDPESVGGAAANVDFVANKVYPTWEGAFITETGSITLEHGCMRVVNVNNSTQSLTNTPAFGTVSWLYYKPVGCSSGTLTLSFSDPIGVPRTYQKTATSGANHLPHWIKCTRCLQGWAIEWETEA